ncbi:universal stress protein [Streptomyces sp. NPDC051366]|uniref:universal stress protein n=1 Tax=Streptomyces sp. NPDC051366 TaxID=3365652 RepID=UPI0037AB7C42
MGGGSRPDEGWGAVRHRVVVGVSGSSGSLTALHRAAGEARGRAAELWVVLAWQGPGGDVGSRGPAGAAVLAAARAAAVERLRLALDTAFGAGGPGVVLEGHAVRATAGAALVDAVDGPGDLLVVGTGARGPIRCLLRPSVARYCLAHAPCPVLTVPPSPLQAELDAVHRRNVWRLPLDARELAE